LFDATEIDEILSLRIQTLSDAEKQAMRELEPRTRRLLERTEALGADDFARLHGELRQPAATKSAVSPGTRVRLCPKRRADIFDLALAGRVATIRSLEEDAEGVRYVCVTVDDDPGADLGISGQPGHRFFFTEDELEPLVPEEAP
jgi:hydrogenase maturation protease